MAWSIFQQGGGKGAAVTWAQDLLSALGVAQSPQNIQFVYDWELAEGGGGKFNPLNQGPVPGSPQLTSTGQQYGGGAADFVSWQAGLQGAVDYLHMPAYAGVLKSLRMSNYQGAASALWSSPWAASHYGYGSNWPREAPPGASNLAGAGPGSIQPSASGDTQTASLGGGVLGTLGDFLGLAGFNIKDALQRLGLILLGGFLILIGVYMLAGKQALQFTPLGKFTPQGQQRERLASAERRREERSQRQGRAEEREKQRLSIRERRQALAERVEERHRGAP